MRKSDSVECKRFIHALENTNMDVHRIFNGFSNNNNGTRTTKTQNKLQEKNVVVAAVSVERTQRNELNEKRDSGKMKAKNKTKKKKKRKRTTTSERDFKSTFSILSHRANDTIIVLFSLCIYIYIYMEKIELI